MTIVARPPPLGPSWMEDDEVEMKVDTIRFVFPVADFPGSYHTPSILFDDSAAIGQGVEFRLNGIVCWHRDTGAWPSTRGEERGERERKGRGRGEACRHHT